MSAVGDALTALKNVVLMQERMDVMQRQLDLVTADLKGVNDYVASVDKRVVRIEALIEFGARGGSIQPRLEE